MPPDEDIDIESAAAESRLAWLDEDGEPDREPSSNGAVGTLDLDRAEADGMHVELDEPDAYEVGGDDPGDLHDDAEVYAVIEGFCEAFNARDLDALLELLSDDCETPGLGNDCANFPGAVEDLWERRPTSLLTRGQLDDEPVAVMWEVGDTGAWWRVAPVHFDAVEDGRVGVVEMVDDSAELDGIEADAPEDELDEGSRWAEWDEGAGV